MKRILLLLILCNSYFDSAAQETDVRNIYAERDDANRQIKIHYTLTENVKDIQLNIRKKETGVYINRAVLINDIDKNILKGERVIYWIPANEDQSGDYSFEFTLEFLDKPSYENCYKILAGQINDCLTLLDTERTRFSKTKLKKTAVWVAIGAASVTGGAVMFSSLRKQSNSFIESQKIYDRDSNGIIDDNLKLPAYEAERASIEQKRKMEPYAKGMMYAGFAVLSFGVGKYIFQRFKGIQCTITQDCQGTKTFTLIKKF